MKDDKKEMIECIKEMLDVLEYVQEKHDNAFGITHNDVMDLIVKANNILNIEVKK